MKNKTNFDTFFENKMKSPDFSNLYEQEKKILALSYKIAQLRKSCNLTQAELAEKIDTKQSVIARIENGKQNISVGMLLKIADALNKKIDIRFV